MIAPLEDARTGQGTTLLIDMNGKVVHQWPLHSYPTKIMPGGYAMGGMTQPGKHLWNSNPKIPTAQAFLGFDLVQMDFNGNIVWDTSKPNGQPRRALDIQRAKDYFGFEAEMPFKEGLKRTIDWYSENNDKIK